MSKVPSRFRSGQRAVSVGLGLAPLVAINTVVSQTGASATDVLPILGLFGPAVLSTVASGYAITRLAIAWACCLVPAGAATALIVSHYGTPESVGLQFILANPIYVLVFLAGFMLEAAMDHAGAWRTARYVVAILFGWWAIQGLAMVLDVQVNGPEFAREGIVSDLTFWGVLALLALLAWPRRRRATAAPSV